MTFCQIIQGSIDTLMRSYVNKKYNNISWQKINEQKINESEIQCGVTLLMLRSIIINVEYK